MNEAIKKYLSDIQEQFLSGQAIEHAYRPALKQLMSSFDDVIAVNDPRHSEHGAPDFVFIQKSNTKIFKGYAEAKDIGIKLDKVEKSNQMERYSGYDNLFLTDYLEFRFFKNGEKYQTISLGHVEDGKLVLTPQHSQLLHDELESFLRGAPEQIRSGKRLAVIMGGYARRIQGNVTRFLSTENEKNESLEKIYSKMKELLVHDLNVEKFADMYAQTLVYGLFVGRYNDTSLDDFTRHEAQQNIPRSNPFLRQFFDHIAGIEFDERLAVVVDELCAVFAVSDVRRIIEKHLRLFEVENDRDPLIHFYEDFLKEYDPSLRKKMGAYYTPTPVVRFIIREVDRILKEDFDIADGIASTEMLEREVETQPWRMPGERKDRTTKQIMSHRVQILDPAVGTATFLNETIKYIYEQKRSTQAGQWPSYVREHLIPRLFGFELMMAPYTIAHLKLGMTLAEQGVTDLGDERLNIYLTNTLEEGVPTQHSFDFGFSEAISEESRLAADVKTTQPIMIVMGNPPYSVSSNNKSEWIQNLIKDYKKNLNEKKINLDDDYIKFIRFAEQMIEKNGSGIVAMITNNSYIDGITHRRMRKHLLQTFDKIYILDLHGSTMKKEKAPDGSKDENVFSIMQGVSIVLMVKTGAEHDSAIGEVYHAELFGTRRDKFIKLSREEIAFEKLTAHEPSYFFVKKDLTLSSEYAGGIGLNELFIVSNSGIKTDRDKLFIDFEQDILSKRVEKLFGGDLSEGFRADYRVEDSSSYKLTSILEKNRFSAEHIKLEEYRPFDYRYIYYDRSVISRPGYAVMSHQQGDNPMLISTRQLSSFDYQHALVSTDLTDICTISSQTKETGYAFPLYTYAKNGEKIENYNPIRLSELLRLCSTNKVLEVSRQPEDVFDYVYATLHSPSYRKKYKEFLKSDFPRIPIPTQKEFERLTPLGKRLRELHLMTSAESHEITTTFPESSDEWQNEVNVPLFSKDTREPNGNGRVYINSQQYFGNVPEIAWNFYIGGYQPAQKWLKDRKGRKLTSDDITHYQRIITILAKTQEIMQEIS